jgi:hypothetical protein
MDPAVLTIFFVVGVLYLVVPRTIAVSFGLPAIPREDATPWLRTIFSVSDGQRPVLAP